MKNAAVKTPRREHVITFIDWLIPQRHRDGTVARLAEHVANDPAWQRASFNDVFGRLVASLPSEHLLGLQQAYREYCEGVEGA